MAGSLENSDLNPSNWFAKGGAFGGNGVTANANGNIFDSPTLFTDTKGGLNVMGEAGPEAVMPLKRGADGRLGVEGGGGGVTINVEGSLISQEDLMDVIEENLDRRGRLTHA